MKFLGHEITAVKGYIFYTVQITDPKGVLVYKLENVKEEDVEMEKVEARFWVIEKLGGFNG